MLGRMMASALAFSSAAHAQTSPPAVTGEAAATEAASGRVVYEAAYFARYNPQTALDMVNQTPGFSLDGGDDERRGFSGAVGNLLIDGLRPSTKSQSLDGILSRIPANQVVRVELLRGGAVAGDASGQAILLNVVRTPNAGSGVWEAGIEYTSRQVPAPRGELSYSGRVGQMEYGVGVSIHSEYRDLPGWRLIYDENEELAATVFSPHPEDFREATLNGNIAFPLAGGRLSATSQINWWRYYADRAFFFSDTAGAPLSTLTSEIEENRPSAELGVNYDRDFGPWSLELIGLINRARYESEEGGANLDFVGTDDFAYLQEVRQDIGESILRATLSRPITRTQNIEFGGEGAFNSLDQQLVFMLDEGGGPMPDDIPNANVLIEEERAEVFATHTWRFAEPWTLESRLAWETSMLTFTGDDDQTVELSYWKPSVQLSRTFGGNNQIRARIYRDVGQLNFDDFVSAAAIADAMISGGNTDLAPETAWIGELGADLRFPGGAALSLTLEHRQITDVQDNVLLVFPNADENPLDPEDDFIRLDAPGNIGDGEMTTLSANFSSAVPFIPGGRLTIEGYVRESEVTDPVTGRPRIISFTPESEIEIAFRQDIPAWRFAWGVETSKQGEVQAYRFNEIDTTEEGPFIDFWVETTALPGNAKLRLTAANINDGTFNRDRRFFQAPDRSSGVFSARELRQRAFAEAQWLLVELSGTF